MASKVGVVPFTLDGLDPGVVAAVLGYEHGMVRLSFGAYTTTADLDCAVDAVAELATPGSRVSATARYAQGPDGTWAPS